MFATRFDEYDYDEEDEYDDDGDVGALPPRPPFEADGAPSEPSEDDVRPDRGNMTTGRGRRARGAARCEGFSDTIWIPVFSEFETAWTSRAFSQ